MEGESAALMRVATSCIEAGRGLCGRALAAESWRVCVCLCENGWGSVLKGDPAPPRYWLTSSAVLAPTLGQPTLRVVSR